MGNLANARTSCLAADGERLAYWVHGSPKAKTTAPFVVHNGLVSSFHHWRPFVRHFAPERTIVTWDYRGHGASPRPRFIATCNVEQFADDGHAVTQASGVTPAIVAGLSFGVQVALEQARRHPADTRALVLICGTYGHPLNRLAPSRRLRGALALAMQTVGRGGWLTTAVLDPILRSPITRELTFLTGGAHRDHCPPDVLDELFAHVAGMDPAVAASIIASYFEHSAEDALAQIQVPTLIIAGDKDELTPVACAERMQRAIRGSRLVVFPGHTHLVQCERPEAVHATIQEFLDEHGL